MVACCQFLHIRCQTLYGYSNKQAKSELPLWAHSVNAGYRIAARRCRQYIHCARRVGEEKRMNDEQEWELYCDKT